MQATQHIIDNFLRHIYCTLKEKDRYVEEGWSRTNYEAIFDTINEAFSPSQSLYRPTNSEVESFYRGTATAEEFVRKVDDRIISKARSKLDGDLDPLLSISWDLYSSVPVRKETCSCIQKPSARRLWAVFNKLDTGRESLVDIDDIADLVSKLYSNAGQEEETKENIQEWFCNQPSVDYWSFYSALVENHRDLLQPMSVQNLHKEVFHEILKEGKMTKKGHKIQTWKMRQFVLTTTGLNYYDDNLVMKGSVVINGSARVDQLPGIKGRSYLFRVTDGTSGTPYDISTNDSQLLKEWIDMLQVVIALHQEGGGRSYLHRMRLAHARVFPNSNKPVPKATNASHSGVYRTISSPVDRITTSPPPALGQENSNEAAPCQHGGTMDNEEEEEEPFSPISILSKPNLPNNRPSSDIMEFENPNSPISKQPHKTDINYAELDLDQPPPPPVHQSCSQPHKTDIDYAELDLDQPPSPPVRQSSSQNQHKPLRQVMSTPTGVSQQSQRAPMSGYIQLNFGAPPVETTAPPVKPLPTAKQRYGYSTVVLSPEVDKDIEKAAKLKQNKPHPGIPVRYGDSSPCTSTISLEGSAKEEPPVPATRKSPAVKPRGVAVLPALPGQNNPTSRNATAIIDDEPPVPPPRVSNNISNDDRVYVNVQSQPPAVPLRSGRRSDDSLPPVPPPRP